MILVVLALFRLFVGWSAGFFGFCMFLFFSWRYVTRDMCSVVVCSCRCFFVQTA